MFLSTAMADCWLGPRRTGAMAVCRMGPVWTEREWKAGSQLGRRYTAWIIQFPAHGEDKRFCAVDFRKDLHHGCIDSPPCHTTDILPREIFTPWWWGRGSGWAHIYINFAGKQKGDNTIVSKIWFDFPHTHYQRSSASFSLCSFCFLFKRCGSSVVVWSLYSKFTRNPHYNHRC